METQYSGRITQRKIPAGQVTAMSGFSQNITDWFRTSVGDPTLAQRYSWPTILGGENLLLCAPTGSGKTLAAMVPILDQLITNPKPSHGVQCLYIAPLKSLCNDVRKSLNRHLNSLDQQLSGREIPSVGLRTGDSSSQARKRILTDPPQILITTPESLALLLTHNRIDSLFSSVRWVIVDEVHEMFGNKRGSDLSLSLERLQKLTRNPPQRIGLSATCRPPELAARFLVGNGRDCTIAEVRDQQTLQVTVEAVGIDSSQTYWQPQQFFPQVMHRLQQELEHNQTILVFTNSRSLAERLGFALRNRLPIPTEQIGVHHSALSAKRRKLLETRFKSGELRIVVATSSLELGLDVGTIDLVVLLHPPGEVVRMLQRIGRSGHGPQRIRRGLILVNNPAELMEAVVTNSTGHFGQTERITMPEKPLDVLCQHLLGIASRPGLSAEEAFEVVKQAYPYRDLTRAEFDDCVRYLAGKDKKNQSWLPARLFVSDSGLSLTGSRTLRILRQNLGTILGERQTPVRTVNDSLLGEVAETFTDSLQPGDRFLLEGRCLEFKRSTKNGLIVEEVTGRPVVPRWLSEGWMLSRELAEHLYHFRSHAVQVLRQNPDELRSMLRTDYGLANNTTELLCQWFEAQEAVSEIPDAGQCFIEAIASDMGVEYYFHTPLNRLANETIARVAVHRLQQRNIPCMPPVVADLGFLLFVESVKDIPPTQWRQLLSEKDFETDLDSALHDSLVVRDRFRRVALTGLMLLKNPIGKPSKVGGHDWAERRLFQKLRDTDADFVLLRQAMREVKLTCLDTQTALEYLQSLPQRAVKIRWLSTVSPFASAWTQSNQEPEDPANPAEVLEKLHATLMGVPDPV